MSEYIVNVSDEESELFIARFGIGGTTLFGHKIIGEIVRCRDCKHYKPYRTNYHGMMNRCHDEHGHTHKRDDCDFCSRGERREE